MTISRSETIMWAQLIRAGDLVSASRIVGAPVGPAARRARLDEHAARARRVRRHALRERSAMRVDHLGFPAGDPADYYRAMPSCARAS